MKTTQNFDETILDNKDLFTSDFYKRFGLRHAPKPIRLTDKIAKDYLFPTFYGNVTCAQAIFLCNYEKAAKMMLHPAVKPVRFPKGRAVVAFACYIYREVLGVPPYNEIAMTMPVLVDSPINLPVLPILMSSYPGFGYYVFSMPVTSKENMLRGHKIWGLPKVTQEIDIFDDGPDCVTVAMEESGEKYFELSVPRDGNPSRMNIEGFIFSKLDNELKKSQTNFRGTFNIQKNIKVLFNAGLKAEKPLLKLFDTPSGRALKDLELEEQPLQTRYAATMEACFDLPRPDYKSKTVRFRG
ncbi:MAG: acetoacetate decarboxylase family protein [Smithella sp.]|jgi:hypothetical protein